jgi:GNAT superfamily N-acetyltransferase
MRAPCASALEPAWAATAYRFREADLSIDATDRADDGVLDAFFAAYDKAFVLANEKEEIGGFRDCLALNAGATHQRLRARYGPFREVVLVARGDAGSIVGGANFIVIQHAADAGHGIGFSVNLNYLFVAPEQRGKSRSRTLLAACRRLARTIADEWRKDTASRGLFFLEINDPFRLTPEQYKLDSDHAGIDQVARLAYWARMGTKVLDWPYVQPALSAEQQDDLTLTLGVLDADRGDLPASLLQWHLERFFAVSVLKGAPLHGSASAQRQVQRLQRAASGGYGVALLELTAALEQLPAQLSRRAERPPNLQAALRQARP